MKLFFKKNVVLIISALYFFMMFLFLLKVGFNVNGEGTKYLKEANGMLKNDLNENAIFSYFYFSYTYLTSLFIKFNISFIFLGVIQILLSYSAAFSLFNLLLFKTKNKLISVLTLFFYLFCFPIQHWTLFLYSEGVHTSLVVIGFCLFLKMLEQVNFKTITLFLIILFLILTTRPVGIIFLISCFTILLNWFFQKKQKQKAYILISISIVFIILILNSPYRFFVNPDSIRRMEIICQVPQKDKVIPYVEYNKTGLIGAYNVIKDEIGVTNFFIMGLKKIKLFFLLVRPYFSFKNNFLLSLYIILYPFAIFGLFLFKQEKINLIKYGSLCYILITTGGIFITCDDWSNRFISPVFPFIIILASFGINWTFDKIKNRNLI